MRAVLALAAALPLLAGCMTLGSRPEPARYYLLEPEATTQDPAREPLPAVGVGPVRLPAYLDRREIVTRAGPGRLDVASTDRWAAPLEDLFVGVLAEDLRAAVPAGAVVVWPWSVAAAPEWSVSVEVLRFESEADGTVVLEARWVVAKGGVPAKRGATLARERRSAPDLAATAVALSRSIGALARDLAAAVDASRGEKEAQGSR